MHSKYRIPDISCTMWSITTHTSRTQSGDERLMLWMKLQLIECADDSCHFRWYDLAANQKAAPFCCRPVVYKMTINHSKQHRAPPTGRDPYISLGFGLKTEHKADICSGAR